MQLIDELESTPRGLYTGAIGWLDTPARAAEDGGTDERDSASAGRSNAGATPAQADDCHSAVSAANLSRCGDFCLSVAIRTLTLCAQPGGTARLRGSMGVGAGIVLDSVAADEYAECRLKASFLTGAEPGFDLFETMYATREDGVRHLARHLRRLSASAATFGFKFDDSRIRERIAAQCASLPAQTPHRVRLALGMNGDAQITAAVLTPLPEASVCVLLGPRQGFALTHAADPLLHHKTTRRADYDRGWREAEAKGAFDTLFFNERGELTEGGRSNVFVKLAGQWWTPPLVSGVLPGVMRGVLLEEDPMGLNAAERILTETDVLRADALLICNALRGALPARIAR